MNTFSVLSWNLMGRSGTAWWIPSLWPVSFAKIFAYLRKHQADVVCLQEFPLEEYEEKLKQLEALGYRVLLGESFKTPRSSAVLTLTRHTVGAHGENIYVLPQDMGNQFVDEDSRVLWFDCVVGEKTVRIYACHFAIRGLGIRERLWVLDRVLEHAKGTKLPTIICGDMNTVVPKKGWRRWVALHGHKIEVASQMIDGKMYEGAETELFAKYAEAAGFLETFPLGQPTWALPYTSIEYTRLKLDWVFTKGLEIKSASMGPYITDHRPVHAKFAR